jgi:hypothetical protein
MVETKTTRKEEPLFTRRQTRQQSIATTKKSKADIGNKE